MEEQIYTQEQAEKMFRAISDFNEDYWAVSEKDKNISAIDLAYIIGFRKLIEEIDSEA